MATPVPETSTQPVGFGSGADGAGRSRQLDAVGFDRHVAKRDGARTGSDGDPRNGESIELRGDVDRPTVAHADQIELATASPPVVGERLSETVPVAPSIG